MPKVAEENIRIYFFFGLLILVGVLSLTLFYPYFGAIVSAATFAIVFNPVNTKIKKYTRNNEVIAAFATLLLVLIIVLVPLAVLGIQVFDQASGIYSSISSRGIEPFLADILPESIESRVLPLGDFDAGREIGGLINKIAGGIGNIFTGTIGFLANFFLFFFILFYLLKDGHRLREWIASFSPLPDEDDKEILNRLENTVNSVIRGAVVVAIIQGIIAGIGYAVFELPNAAFWGSITTISALIPGIGTALIIFPAIIYLFVLGSTFNAVGLLIWGIVAVGLIDNILAPKLINRKTHLHPLLILLAVVGGLSIFGPLGFLIGPLIFSFFFALLDIYKMGELSSVEGSLEIKKKKIKK